MAIWRDSVTFSWPSHCIFDVANRHQDSEVRRPSRQFGKYSSLRTGLYALLTKLPSLITCLPLAIPHGINTPRSGRVL